MPNDNETQVFKGGGAGGKRGEALERGSGNNPSRNPSFCKKLGRWGKKNFLKSVLPRKTKYHIHDYLPTPLDAGRPMLL